MDLTDAPLTLLIKAIETALKTSAALCGSVLLITLIAAAIPRAKLAPWSPSPIGPSNSDKWSFSASSFYSKPCIHFTATVLSIMYLISSFHVRLPSIGLNRTLQNLKPSLIFNLHERQWKTRHVNRSHVVTQFSVNHIYARISKNACYIISKDILLSMRGVAPIPLMRRA